MAGDVSDALMELAGGDMFEGVRRRSDEHQRRHGCGLYNAGGPQMLLISRFGSSPDRRRFSIWVAGSGYVCGQVIDLLDTLERPVDMIHDDAWFAAPPDDLDKMIGLLRPGGLLAMVNWFLLVDALTGEPRNDWAAFAGEDWAEQTRSYAQMLAARTDLQTTWIQSPPIAFAIKQ